MATWLNMIDSESDLSDSAATLTKAFEKSSTSYATQLQGKSKTQKDQQKKGFKTKQIQQLASKEIERLANIPEEVKSKKGLKKKKTNLETMNEFAMDLTIGSDSKADDGKVKSLISSKNMSDVQALNDVTTELARGKTIEDSGQPKKSTKSQRRRARKQALKLQMATALVESEKKMEKENASNDFGSVATDVNEASSKRKRSQTTKSNVELELLENVEESKYSSAESDIVSDEAMATIKKRHSRKQATVLDPKQFKLSNTYPNNNINDCEIELDPRLGLFSTHAKEKAVLPKFNIIQGQPGEQSEKPAAPLRAHQMKDQSPLLASNDHDAKFLYVQPPLAFPKEATEEEHPTEVCNVSMPFGEPPTNYEYPMRAVPSTSATVLMNESPIKHKQLHEQKMYQIQQQLGQGSMRQLQPGTAGIRPAGGAQKNVYKIINKTYTTMNFAQMQQNSNASNDLTPSSRPSIAGTGAMYMSQNQSAIGYKAGGAQAKMSASGAAYPQGANAVKMMTVHSTQHLGGGRFAQSAQQTQQQQSFSTRTFTRVPGVQGEEIPLTYVTEANGQITNVAMLPTDNRNIVPVTVPMPVTMNRQAFSRAGTQQPMAGNATYIYAPPPGSNIKYEYDNFSAGQLHQFMQSRQPFLAMNQPGGSVYTASVGVPIMAAQPTPSSLAGAEPHRKETQEQEQAVEDEEVDYEEIGVADTYAEYWPSKLKGGVAHPDAVVETATLSSVELPDITFKLALPPKIQSSGCLSALQLEAVLYACQAHEQFLPNEERAGFLLGDGAGVGKGRTIAAIIYENFLRGRDRALWISVSNDLKFDAERDLLDIGAHDSIKVVTMNKFRYARINSPENDFFKRGIIFCTYTALIGESLTAKSKYRTRLRQLINWLGKQFDGVIVFDECHKAKNLSLMNLGKSTKTGTTVLELQQMLPKARVVYASATGASEPRNMAYMVRLGLWGPGTAYPEFHEFVNAVEKRGIGAMEIVAMDMKLRGTYIARQLSFKDVSFRIEEVAMSREFRKVYNHAAELWAEINKKFLKACRLMCIENRVQKIITCQFWCAHQRFFKNLCIASKVSHVVKMTRQAVRMGKAVVIGLQSTGESRTLEHLERHQGQLSNFVSTSKMIIQSFVEKHFPAPKRELFHKLLNTGKYEPEARLRPHEPKRQRMNPDWFDDDMDAEAGESDIEMFESGCHTDVDDDRLKAGRKRRGRPPKADKVEKVTMQDRILMHLYNNMRSRDVGEPTYTFDNSKPQKANITERDVERCITAREHLLEKIERLGRKLPANTLDKLICELGSTDQVAEMTGRRGRVIKTNGFRYEPRCEGDTSMDLVNYREKQHFMEGKKFMAIISEAASSGISLQSDKRVSNQRRRLHITLELPWSADRAIQQFGRTHRSNQVNSPEYVFLITDLAGERRFASTVAKRLESLGALTQGDRRATDARDLSQFNIDNSIGRTALESVMQEITGEKPLDWSQVPESYHGDFSMDCCLAMAGVGMVTMREEDKVKSFTLEKDSNNISKFLNRILGCRVEVQNALFKFFLDKMYSLIMQMKRMGRFDLGILDLDAHGANVTAIKLVRFTRNHATGAAATELHTVKVERGMAFEKALQLLKKEQRHEFEGFYILQQPRNNNNCSILCLNAQPDAPVTGVSCKVTLQIYRPNTGPQVRTETLASITNRYLKVPPEAAFHFWRKQYGMCLDMCSHMYWTTACPFSKGCEVGLRVRTYHVLSGLMLPIWDRIELIIEKMGQKIQMIRVKTDVNKKIVGTVVPNAVYEQLVTDLSSDSTVEEVTF